jgi:hypothetical protein
MRKLMAARPKSFIINELIQNGWDAKGTTRVDVTLTEPDANGHSILTVTDDAPKGSGEHQPCVHDVRRVYEDERSDEARTIQTKARRQSSASISKPA